MIHYLDGKPDLQTHIKHEKFTFHFKAEYQFQNHNILFHRNYYFSNFYSIQVNCSSVESASVLEPLQILT